MHAGMDGLMRLSKRLKECKVGYWDKKVVGRKKVVERVKG